MDRPSVARSRGYPRLATAVIAPLGLLLAPLAMAAALVAGPGAATACATGTPHAALVVATGDQTLRYCVMLDGSSVTAIHVIELAHTQHGLEYRLGFGGQAVCRLAGVGSATGDCFGLFDNSSMKQTLWLQYDVSGHCEPLLCARKSLCG